MRTLIGLSVVAVGVALGVWLGVWVMLVGGIVQLINGVKATPVNATWIAFGIARVMFSGFCGWVSGLIGVSIGTAILA